MNQTLPTLKVALLGCGVVGSEVARLLTEQGDDLALRVGARLELAGIAVRRVGHRRAAAIDRSLLTADPHALATRPDVDIVVEVIGGIEPARSLLLAALKGGKPVVTANKALLAEDGAAIHGAAREYGADLYYEASVAGAIPLLRPLRESLAGDHVRCVVKLLAICERTDDGVSVRVHPAMIPRSHPLAGVREAYNAVFVEAESAGRLMFYGAGAGGVPTASAVLGDIVAVARNRLAGTRGPDTTTYAGLPVLPMGQAMTRYHIALDVADRPGVLARVAESFARHEVSIKAVRQEGRGDDAQLVIVTHSAQDAALASCVADLGAMDVVRAVASVMRVEGESDE